MGRCMVGSSLVSARDQHLTLCFFSCFQGAAGHFYFMDEYIICLSHVDDLSFTVSSPDHTGISSLTTAFCVERCFIQDHAACLALACCICIAFCANDRFNEACIKQRFVSGEVCLAFHGKLCIYFIPACIIHFLFRLGTLFLFFHSLFEAVQVDLITGLFQDLPCQVDRETVGIVQLERLFAVKRFASFCFQFIHVGIDDLHALIDGGCEFFFFDSDDFFDHIAALFQLRIRIAGSFDHLFGKFRQERSFDAQDPAVTRCTSDETAQYIFSAFVTRQNRIADHKRHGAQMIRDNTDGNVRFCFPVLIFNSGFSHYCIQDIFDSIYVENGFYTLHDARQTFDPHTCIDVRMGQIAVVSFIVAAELCEHMVPELNVTVAVTSRLAVRVIAAVFLAAVKIDFRARTAWTSPDLPEVIILAQTHDPLFRHADNIAPDGISVVIVFIYGSPESVRRHFQYFRNEFPAPGQGFFLKVISERKASQHFEECTVSGSISYVFDIAGTNALLAGGHALARRCFDSCKVRLQRRHT